MSIHGDEAVKALCSSIQRTWQDVNDKKERSSDFMTRYLMAEGSLTTLEGDVVKEDTLTKSWDEVMRENDAGACEAW